MHNLDNLDKKKKYVLPIYFSVMLALTRMRKMVKAKGGRLGPVEQIMRKAIQRTRLGQNVTRKYFEYIQIHSNANIQER